MTFLMSFFGILVPGVPANCIGDIADAPAADIGGKDDGGAAAGGTTVDGTGAAGGTAAGAVAGMGVGSGGGRGKRDSKDHLACWMCHCIPEIRILEELKKEKAVWIPASSATTMNKGISSQQIPTCI
uniref:Uncharacterized protein n=1 Tax=Oryza rufipogon TaxID=4529 RepID=A0A0E0Q4F7_ORYRU